MYLYIPIAGTVVLGGNRVALLISNSLAKGLLNVMQALALVAFSGTFVSFSRLIVSTVCVCV